MSLDVWEAVVRGDVIAVAPVPPAAPHSPSEIVVNLKQEKVKPQI